MTKYTYSFLTIDGIKTSFLEKGIKKNIKEGFDIINIIGHPKLQTAYSIQKLDKVLSKQNNVEYVTIKELYNKLSK